MTACVDNNQKKGGAAKAVSATLAGVLAVGMVPAVAFADDGQAPEQEGDVSLLDSVESAAAFNDGVVKFKINGGSQVTEGDETYSGTEFKITDVTVTPRGLSTAIDIDSDENADNYRVYFVKADAEGEPTTEKVEELVDAGSYFIAVEAIGGTYEGGIAYAEFNISGKSLAGATAYAVNAEDATDTTTKTFTYKAEAQTIGFIDSNDSDKILAAGKDYTVKYYEASEDYNDAAAGSETAPTDAGSYYARLTGIGAYAGQTVIKDFEIAPFDLSTAEVYVPQVVGATTLMPKQPATVNGSEALAAKVKLTYGELVGDLGEFTATVEPVTKDDPNFKKDDSTDQTKTGTVDVVKVARAATITYNGAAMPAEMNINLSAGQAFSEDLIKVMDGDKEVTKGATGTEEGQYKVEYQKMVDGQPQSAALADLKNAGTYIVTVTVNPVTSGDEAYQLGGSAQMTVKVTTGVIDCATNLYVSYDGEIVTSVEADYAGGADITTMISTALYKDANTTTPLTKDTDYFVKYYDADGKEVAAITDAGSYTMEITSNTYTIENGTVDIVVNPVTVEAIRIAQNTADPATAGTLVVLNGRYVLNYTGSVIDPAFEYTTGERNADGDLVWVNETDDESAAKVFANSTISYTYEGEAVDEVKEIGNYTATIAAGETEGADNYTFAAEPYKFAVAKALDFVDVPTGAWFYEYVQAVINQNANYMGGYGDSGFFGPNDPMKRGDVAMVFARMAGVDLQADQADDELSDSVQSFATPFSDVDGNMYYAQAIAWAAQAGIVTGDTGSDTFRPEDTITRQEFALMLYRYAQKAGTDVSVDATAELAQYTDAADVASWAANAVAWLSSEEIMTGIGGTSVMEPQSEVTRAQVAKMTTEYQPARIKLA